MKYLILVGDGMGDFPIESLGGKTPLAAADTPMMDELCRSGELFLNHTVPQGFPPGSDVANMSLMGYDPAAYYTGRAPIEAAAMGLKLAPDEIAFRCNFITMERPADGRVFMRDFSAGHITSEESHQLIAALEEECASDMFHFKPGVSYRHLVIFKGEHPGITTVPPHDYIEQDVTGFFNSYLNLPDWRALLEKVEKVLAAHPVNRKRRESGKSPATMVWLWGEGKMPVMPTLTERFGITGTMISAVDLLKGLGVLGGLTVVDVPGATGYIDTNYEGKAKAAIDALKTQDFVFVHVEAPDEAGHQGSLEAKMQAITDFDLRIVKPIIDALAGEDFRVVVTMDHFTPLSLRTHVDDPVPTLLYDSRKRLPGSGLPFCEAASLTHDQKHNNRLLTGHSMIDKLLER